MNLASFQEHFSAIAEPRQFAKVSYPLFDILFLTVAAVVTGCEGWEDIEDFGLERLEWLNKFGMFSDGIPAHDTIARVISRIDAKAMQSAFVGWMQDAVQKTDGEVIAIDGKTLCSSYRPGERKSAIHMVSAFATANGVVMGQVKTGEKSGEYQAIPELLKLLELKGCLVSIDAQGCYVPIAEAIVARKADYLLAVKGNQPNLQASIQAAFGSADVAPEVTMGRQHGRAELREYKVLASSVLPSEIRSQWPKLTLIGEATSYRNDGRTESLERRYYISSADLSAERFAKAVRSHWGIENQLHWVLDTALREDDCVISRGEAPANLACARHIALNLLRAEKSKKRGVKGKQRVACMSTDYLEQVLGV